MLIKRASFFDTTGVPLWYKHSLNMNGTKPIINNKFTFNPKSYRNLFRSVHPTLTYSEDTIYSIVI